MRAQYCFPGVLFYQCFPYGFFLNKLAQLLEKLLIVRFFETLYMFMEAF